MAKSGFLNNAAKFGEPSVFHSVGVIPSLQCTHFLAPGNQLKIFGGRIFNVPHTRSMPGMYALSNFANLMSLTNMVAVT